MAISQFSFWDDGSGPYLFTHRAMTRGEPRWHRATDSSAECKLGCHEPSGRTRRRKEASPHLPGMRLALTPRSGRRISVISSFLAPPMFKKNRFSVTFWRTGFSVYIN